METQKPEQVLPLGQIIQGDNVEVLKTFPDNCIDLTVTSPPYDNLRTYKGYSFNFEGVAEELYRVTKDGGVVVWVVNDAVKDNNESGTSYRQALYFQELGFSRRTIIYEKDPRYPNSKFYKSAHEYMFVLSKGECKTYNPITDIKVNNRYKSKICTNRNPDGQLVADRINTNPITERSTIWYYSSGYMKTTKDEIAYEHPAIFPDELAQDVIQTWSNEGDIILDPFAGSGTTLKAAEKLMRKWVGIEIAPEYIKIAEKRLEPYRNQTRL